MGVEIGDVGFGRLADIRERLRHAASGLPWHRNRVTARRLDLAEQRVAGTRRERGAPPRFDSALGDRHRRRHDIDAPHQLIDPVGRRVVAFRQVIEPHALDRRQADRRPCELVAERKQVRAVRQHALIDVEHRGQDGSDEQRLAFVAPLAAEILRHAFDLDRRHRLALPDVRQGIGRGAEEAGELVGRPRIERPLLALAAQRIARRSEPTVAEKGFGDLAIERVVRLARRLLDENQRLGLGIQQRQLGLIGSRAGWRKEEIGFDIRCRRSWFGQCDSGCK